MVLPEQTLMFFLVILFKVLSDTSQVTTFPVFHSFWGTWSWLVTETRPFLSMPMSLVDGDVGFESVNHLIVGLKPHPEHKSVCCPGFSPGFRRTSTEGSTKYDGMKRLINNFNQYIRFYSTLRQVSPKRLLIGFDLKGLLVKPCFTEQVKLASSVRYFSGRSKLLLTECGPGPLGISTHWMPGISTPLTWKVTQRSCGDSCVMSHWRTAPSPFSGSGNDLLISTCGGVSAGPGWWQHKVKQNCTCTCTCTVLVSCPGRVVHCWRRSRVYMCGCVCLKRQQNASWATASY